MASSVDTTLSDFKINSVASEAVLKQMEQDGLLEPNQIYMTPDDSASQTYSTEEQFTGNYWIDGKPIYKKVINFGTLPNTGSKEVYVDSLNIDKLITMRGMAYRKDAQINLPHYDKSYYIVMSYNISSSSGKFVAIYASNDRSSFTESYLILEYTKK